MYYVNILAHYLIPPSVFAFFSAWYAGPILIAAAIALFFGMTGSGKVVSVGAEVAGEVAKPIAGAAGDGAAWYLRALPKGLSVMAANPVVFAPVSVIVLGIFCHWVIPQGVALKSANASLAQCVSKQKISTKPKVAATKTPDWWPF